MTYFGHASAAARYGRSRPYFHPLVIGKIADELDLQTPVARALDVACGTGQSALALKQIAAEVIGTDVSRPMLAQAPAEPGLRYAAASAERPPFPAGAFDLLTVALAFHWFDRDRFLAEARRVLRPDGWLVIYDNFFRGEMRENPAFADWVRGHHLPRYPTPPRDRRPLTAADAAAHGFRYVKRESYTNDIVFASADELADYLTTQSNVIAAVEEGDERLDDVRSWLTSELRPIFLGSNGTFAFGGAIDYLAAI